MSGTLKLIVGHCGDEICNCIHVKISRIHPASECVWESSWYTAIEPEDIEELRKETKAACEKFGLTCDLSDHPTDWECGTESDNP